MRFPGIRLVERTEQKFRRFESVFRKKTSHCNSRSLLLIKALTKNVAHHFEETDAQHSYRREDPVSATSSLTSMTN